MHLVFSGNSRSTSPPLTIAPLISSQALLQSVFVAFSLKLLFQDSTIQVFSVRLSQLQELWARRQDLSFLLHTFFILEQLKEFFLLFSFAGKVKTHERQGCSSILTFWLQNLAIFHDNFWKIFHENNFNSTSCKLRWSLLKINHFLVTW